MPQPPIQSQCGFHGPGGLVVLETDLRNAVAAAALGEHKRWFPAGSAQKEDLDAHFPDLVNYWLAGMDSSIRPDFLEALKAVTAGVTYGSVTNAALNAAIQAFNAADARFESAVTEVYTRSADVDAARADLAPLKAPAKAAISRVWAARRALNSIQPKPANQAAIQSARTALESAVKDRDLRVAARDAAQAALDSKTKALAQANANLATERSLRGSLESAASNWPAADLKQARNDLFAQSAMSLPKTLQGSVDAALASAHNSRADVEPWSSAFVGSCVRAAAMSLGLEAVAGNDHRGKDGLLKISRKHSAYITEARNRAAAGRYQTFEPFKRVVRIGDIVSTDRKDFIQRSGRQTLKGLTTGTLLHGDIVTRIETGANGFAEAIGGNVAQTVRRRRYPLDPDGKLVVREDMLIDQEDDSGNFKSGGSLGPFKTLPSKPSMVDRRSSFRVFALLSPVGKCPPAPKTSREASALVSPFLKEEILADETPDVSGPWIMVNGLESPFLVELPQVR